MCVCVCVLGGGALQNMIRTRPGQIFKFACSWARILLRSRWAFRKSLILHYLLYKSAGVLSPLVRNEKAVSWRTNSVPARKHMPMQQGCLGAPAAASCVSLLRVKDSDVCPQCLLRNLAVALHQMRVNAGHLRHARHLNASPSLPSPHRPCMGGFPMLGPWLLCSQAVLLKA